MPRLFGPLSILIFATLTLAGQTPSSDLATRRAALAAVFRESWESNLKFTPEFASMLGDRRYNDRLQDCSEAAYKKAYQDGESFLARMEAIDPTGLSEQERLSRALFIRAWKLELEGAKFKAWEVPVTQLSGPQTLFPSSVRQWPFETVKDYEDYRARLTRFPAYLEQNMVEMRKGMRDGLMPASEVMPEAIRSCDQTLAAPLENSPFCEPLTRFPSSFTTEQKARLKASIKETVTGQVLPAFQRFTSFLKAEYAPKARREPGVWSLPNGRAYYRYLVRVQTTTDLTAAQIHQIGLAEVARIEADMAIVAHKLGFKDVKALNASLAGNPALHVDSKQALLNLYDRYIQQMWAKLPQLFNRIPTLKVQVLPVSSVQEGTEPSAAFQIGAPDGSRPAAVMVNTGEFEKRLTPDIESTAYHEGVPGHHMQMAIAQQLPEVPTFQKYVFFTAFVEGWALYSERLGLEVGFYQDPYSYYGYLQNDLLRALRLVVDTGLHDMGWSRQQVRDYLSEHSGLDDVEIRTETDRYISWPGQALAYKLGQLKILELRAYAQKALGSRFDIRAFHDEVLGAGALPLDLLDARIKTWVASQQPAMAQVLPATK